MRAAERTGPEADDLDPQKRRAFVTGGNRLTESPGSGTPGMNTAPPGIMDWSGTPTESELLPMNGDAPTPVLRQQAAEGVR